MSFRGTNQSIHGFARSVRLVCLASLILSAVIGGGKTHGQEQTVDTERVFNSIGEPDWYDREQDSFAEPKVLGPEDDSELRSSGYKAAPPKKRNRKNKASNTGQGGTRWNGGLLNGFGEMLSYGFLVLLACLLIAVVGLLTFHSFRTYMPGRFEKKQSSKKIEIDPTKVTELPFETAQANYSDPLSAADSLRREGKFNDAILFLYGYQLLALDQARKIELQKGKTNRTYLRELFEHQRLRELLELTMLSFEDVYFGKHEISQERFLASWNTLDEFNHLAAERKMASEAPVVKSEIATV